jgi:hypothetical protein
VQEAEETDPRQYDSPHPQRPLSSCPEKNSLKVTQRNGNILFEIDFCRCLGLSSDFFPCISDVCGIEARIRYVTTHSNAEYGLKKQMSWH